MSKIKFDDVVTDEHSTWVQVCEPHAKKLGASLEDDSAQGTCGVEGCDNEADYYHTVSN